MNGKIRVRLVPKSPAGESLTLHLNELSPRTAKRFAPDASRGREALRGVLNMSRGITASLGPQNTVTSTMPQEMLRDFFGVECIERSTPQEYSKRQVASATYYAPAPGVEVPVPEALQETIAFAYIPTPPLFMAASPIPPRVRLYHLTLGDVVASLGGARCHRRGWTGRGIRVAMADTGFANHPFFEQHGFNITRVHTPQTDHPLIDTNGHGTGESANVLVLAPDCAFFGVKHDDYSAQALETSLAQNPRVITNSWGWNIDTQTQEDLRQTDPNLYNEMVDVDRIINDAIDDGVVVIFSAGNGHRAFPASLPEVLSIGGVTVEQNGGLKASSYASSFLSVLYPDRAVPDVCGIVGEFKDPGPMPGHIMLPVPPDSELASDNMPGVSKSLGWGIFSGTSAAAPQVAGIVALMLSANPNLTPANVREILSDTAHDVERGSTGLGDTARPGHDRATGAGFVDAFAACSRAFQLLNP